MSDYTHFLADKAHLGGEHGFEPTWLPAAMFPFQQRLTEWALRKGRAAIFADCGLGKTLIQLAWAENVVRHANRPVLLLTPLAVSYQTLAEAQKFGIDARRATPTGNQGIVVTNYERLHLLSADDFAGCVCDESSILKSFDGARRNEITQFIRKLPYRLLCTATAAPNDYIELGTSSEALGYLGYSDMLTRFFKNDQNNIASGRQWGGVVKWRFKGHAKRPFWRWVSSWARAIRKPSDMGCDDGGFSLPPLVERQHLVADIPPADGSLFTLPAHGLHEQREERRRTLTQRCEAAARLAMEHDGQSLLWCHLNDEGDLLEHLIGRDHAVQVSGGDDDDAKERAFTGFAAGDIRVLVTKPKIGAWGLNFQNCAHMTLFPSHSYEQYYQGVRRCWRFGQQRPVLVNAIVTPGDEEVFANLRRKAAAADKMFDAMLAHMHQAQSVERQSHFNEQEAMPTWL